MYSNLGKLLSCRYIQVLILALSDKFQEKAIQNSFNFSITGLEFSTTQNLL